MAFRAGDRVLIDCGEYPEFWANGAVGTVAGFPAAVASTSGPARMVRTMSGLEPYYWVVLDEPRCDEDGDGPHAEAEFAGAWLHRLDP
jgi:hypothetical protein